MARAIYRSADIYLLDDPLSAVDSHVSRHLFDQCIKEFLSEKIVILVTHQLQYLPNVDQIALLEHGNLNFYGTYEKFKDSEYDIKNINSVSEEKDESDGDKFVRHNSITSVKSETSYDLHSNEWSLSPLKDEPEEKPRPKAQEEKRVEGSIGLYVGLT